MIIDTIRETTLVITDSVTITLVYVGFSAIEKSYNNYILPLMLTVISLKTSIRELAPIVTNVQFLG